MVVESTALGPPRLEDAARHAGAIAALPFEEGIVATGRPRARLCLELHDKPTIFGNFLHENDVVLWPTKTD
eukprot:11214085-Lingulodinium_polyedra.AAC.1